MNTDIKEKYQQQRRYSIRLPKISYTVKTRSMIWLAVTILTVSFFLIAAIKPTLTTIAQLNREIKDKEEANQQLQKKINALITAQENYAKNSDNLILLDQALPENSEFPTLAYFLEQVATQSGVTLKSLNFERIDDRAETRKQNSPSTGQSFNFSLAASGEYVNLKGFLASLEASRRILTLTGSTFSKNKKNETETELQLSVSGKASFAPKSQVH